MTWTKALALLMAASVLIAPAPAFSPAAAAIEHSLPQDYAAREAQAADLESFTGGWHGVVITLIVIGLIVWLVYELSVHHDEVFHHEDPAKPQPKP
jgi:heme/copper-type cytochrome/quinol oxidase subunit 2